MITAWLAHLYTASGALFAFLALNRIFYDRYRDAFFWLFLAVIVDATDGALARRAAVASRLPWFDGAKLDDIVDYLTYVFVPAFLVWHALLVPDRWSTAVVGALLLSSAYGFNRNDAKTQDHFFTGFPSYWNIVAFYLYLAGWAREVNAGILLVLAALVFVPVRYIYPSRTLAWRGPTLALGALWGALMIVMLWRMPAVPQWMIWNSLIFPAYYLLLSLALEGRRRGWR
ncbi:MAG: CDP-diacylglycerol O-phosphatidyltransferase [Acidobacteria bacterium]|nr:CDP-diacylglycerol O-phosphatidyltransferase [Acidobacteriota bacterium]